MTSAEDLQKTRTRPFATTIAAASAEHDSAPGRQEAERCLPGPGSVVGNHYKLVRLLGEGNFGKVYEATRIDIPEHRVALKLLPRSFYVGRNLERELVMLAKVGHPHVVQLMDHGVTDNFVWLTMPVYQGETLAERLIRGPLDAAEAHAVFLPIARAIEALHHAGLRHQDVKPDNIFLARFAGRLHPVLLDLGVAAEKDATFVAGTALYAAPEQLEAILGDGDAGELDERMDVYCFGATLLRALTSEASFPGAQAKTRRDVTSSHVVRAEEPLASDAALEFLDDARDRLTNTLRELMALRAAERPSMNEAAAALDVLLEPERERDRETGREREADRRSLRRWRIAVAAVMLAAGALGGFALWKRETLRLASELEQARAQGAESFDKLDTCVASNAVTRRQSLACVADLTRERGDHDKTLASLAKQGEGFGDLVEQLKDARSKVVSERKKHEDELSTEQEARRVERERLLAEKQVLDTEQKRLKSDLEARGAELSALRAERDQLLANQTVSAPTSSPMQGMPPGGPLSPPSGTSSPNSTPDDLYESPPLKQLPANAPNPTSLGGNPNLESTQAPPLGTSSPADGQPAAHPAPHR